jgi:hypothetical protein
MPTFPSFSRVLAPLTAAVTMTLGVATAAGASPSVAWPGERTITQLTKSSNPDDVSGVYVSKRDPNIAAVCEWPSRAQEIPVIFLRQNGQWRPHPEIPRSSSPEPDQPQSTRDVYDACFRPPTPAGTRACGTLTSRSRTFQNMRTKGVSCATARRIISSAPTHFQIWGSPRKWRCYQNPARSGAAALPSRIHCGRRINGADQTIELTWVS